MTYRVGADAASVYRPTVRSSVGEDVARASERAAFGRRLRAERERRHADLKEMSERTNIAPRHFEALERGDVSRWPGGMYRRAMIRAYCDSAGLDAAAVEHDPHAAIVGPADERPQPVGIEGLVFRARLAVAAGRLP